MSLDALTRRKVRERAQDACEYCRMLQEEIPYTCFHIEHIISRQHDGTDEFENLALSCHWCNFNKGPNVSTIVDGKLTPLFHPRQMHWNDHFETNEDKIVGLTAIGKGTVKLLDMNDDDRMTIRKNRE